MTEPLRVAHYLNQFFGGLGGEEHASLGPKLIEGAVGPGMALKNAIKARGDVVATAICGDNYFSEKMDEAIHEIIEGLRPERPL